MFFGFATFYTLKEEKKIEIEKIKEDLKMQKTLRQSYEEKEEVEKLEERQLNTSERLLRETLKEGISKRDFSRLLRLIRENGNNQVRMAELGPHLAKVLLERELMKEGSRSLGGITSLISTDKFRALVDYIYKNQEYIEKKYNLEL